MRWECLMETHDHIIYGQRWKWCNEKVTTLNDVARTDSQVQHILKYPVFFFSFILCCLPLGTRVYVYGGCSPENLQFSSMMWRCLAKMRWRKVGIPWRIVWITWYLKIFDAPFVYLAMQMNLCFGSIDEPNLL